MQGLSPAERQAYEEALLRGLCHEGALEVAIRARPAGHPSAGNS
ncbi:MAG: hypothetical protein ABI765_05545 [Gemmatimonadota bacterium]